MTEETFNERNYRVGYLQGVKDEQERWIHQPANEHDEKIRAAERARLAKLVEMELDDGFQTECHTLIHEKRHREGTLEDDAIVRLVRFVVKSRILTALKADDVTKLEKDV